MRDKEVVWVNVCVGAHVFVCMRGKESFHSRADITQAYMRHLEEAPFQRLACLHMWDASVCVVRSM